MKNPNPFLNKRVLVSSLLFGLAAASPAMASGELSQPPGQYQETAVQQPGVKAEKRFYGYDSESGTVAAATDSTSTRGFSQYDREFIVDADLTERADFLQVAGTAAPKCDCSTCKSCAGAPGVSGRLSK